MFEETNDNAKNDNSTDTSTPTDNKGTEKVTIKVANTATTSVMQQNKEEEVKGINEESGEEMLDGLDSRAMTNKITFQYQNRESN